MRGTVGGERTACGLCLLSPQTVIAPDPKAKARQGACELGVLIYAAVILTANVCGNRVRVGGTKQRKIATRLIGSHTKAWTAEFLSWVRLSSYESAREFPGPSVVRVCTSRWANGEKQLQMIAGKPAATQQGRDFI